MSPIVREMEKYVLALAYDQHEPQRKFLRLYLPAILTGGSLVLGRITEALARRPRAKIRLNEKQAPSREAKRLYDTLEHYFSRHLQRPRLDVTSLLNRYLEAISSMLRRDDGEGVNVAVDGCDFAKEKARPHRPRGMQGATIVYDGSRSTKTNKAKVMGFPGLTVEASLPTGNQVPILHWLYSREMKDSVTNDPWRSDPKTWQRIVSLAAPRVGPRAWWSFDRGFASNDMFEFLDGLKVRWIVRIPAEGPAGTRSARNADGIELPIDQWASILRSGFTVQVPEGRDKKKILTITMALAKVQLRKESSRGRSAWSDRWRTLLVARFDDAETPMVLLASEDLDHTMETAELLRTEYRRRWRVEESHRLAKNDEGWGGDVEGFRVLQFRSIQRAIFGWMFASGFVALLRDRYPKSMEALASEAHAPGDLPTDIRYRLNAAVGEEFRDWLPREWKRRKPVSKEEAKRVPEEATLRDRLRNAERAVARARRAYEARSLTAKGP